jgi:hypothetical protein
MFFDRNYIKGVGGGRKGNHFGQRDPIMEETYKSPKGKLVRFFKKSRDIWKSKCKDLRRQKKRLESKIYYYKEQSKVLEEKLKAIEEREAQFLSHGLYLENNEKKTN